MNTLEIFGATVERIRKQRDITQQELAAMLQISQPSLHKVEKGKTNIPLMQALLISRLLGINLDKLPIRLGIKK